MTDAHGAGGGGGGGGTQTCVPPAAHPPHAADAHPDVCLLRTLHSCGSAGPGGEGGEGQLRNGCLGGALRVGAARAGPPCYHIRRCTHVLGSNVAISAAGHAPSPVQHAPSPVPRSMRAARSARCHADQQRQRPLACSALASSVSPRVHSSCAMRWACCRAWRSGRRKGRFRNQRLMWSATCSIRAAISRLHLKLGCDRRGKQGGPAHLHSVVAF